MAGSCTAWFSGPPRPEDRQVPGPACSCTAAPQLWSVGDLVDVREAHALHRVQVIQIAPELLKAMGRRQRVCLVAEVVLAEFAGVVAKIKQKFGDRRRAGQQGTGRAGQLRHDHARAQRIHAGGERGAPGGAALLRVGGHEYRAFLRDAVDVGRLPDHQPAVVGSARS